MKNTTPLICVPSWVIPGTYAENLNFLENKKDIRAVELLFFIYDEEVKSQFNDESEKIKEYSKRFIFTAHLPENQLQTSGPLIERLQPYVRHFIVHPLKENTAGQAKLLADWHRQYNVKFLIENTNPGLFEAFLPNLDFLDASAAGICMDTGHLLLEGKSPVEFFKTHRERIGEIHLHAVDRVQAAADNRLADHRRLRAGETWLTQLLPLLKDFDGIINLEVFSWEEAEAGVRVLLEGY